MLATAAAFALPRHIALSVHACRASESPALLARFVDEPRWVRERAVVLAGRLASTHGGTVAVLAAPPRDTAFQRAIAASQRILLQATGTAPRLVGEPLPREEIIRSTAVALPASLVILGTGHSETERRIAAEIADRVGSSVLALPSST